MRLWKHRCKCKIFVAIVIIFITICILVIFENYITESDELDSYWEVVLREYDNEIPVVIVDEHQEGNENIFKAKNHHTDEFLTNFMPLSLSIPPDLVHFYTLFSDIFRRYKRNQ